MSASPFSLHRVGSGLLSLVLSLGLVQAQDHQDQFCGAESPERISEITGDDPVKLAEIAQEKAQLEAYTNAFVAANYGRSGGNYLIPVVFHIIHNNGPENISDEQVQDAVRILNEDFNQLNFDWDAVDPTFLGIVSNVGINFRLAERDPNGNCAKGITRTESVLTYDGTQDMKDLIQWPRNKYLNVWIAASAAGAAGYALYPSSVSGPWGAAADGIVLLHNYVGSIGTSTQGRSRALTHEVGHWLNLAHTWGSTNDPGVASNCNSDDNVTDTPNTIGWTSCNIGGATCSSVDNVENFMEYSYCSKMFTEGQKQRMLAALTSTTAQRNQLWQPSNLAATGVDGPGVLCAAEFSSNTKVICQGDSILFSDDSYHNVTEWSWNFVGGDPVVTTAEDPVVVYDQPGTYSVSLTVGDGQGTVSTTQSDYVVVLPATGALPPLVEDFENAGTLPNADWLLNDPVGGSQWEVVTSAAYSGSKSLRLDNYYGEDGAITEFVSTTYDMSNVSQVVLSFKASFARRNAANNDALRIYFSADCGKSWSMRKQLRATSSLTTAGNVSGYFTPTSASQWQEVIVDNLPASYFVSGLRFKFWFEADGGNNLYIDDINLNGTPVGIDDMTARNIGLMVVPNPASDNARVVFDLRESSNVLVELLDMAGRRVSVLSQGRMPAGPQWMDLPVRELESGLYLVRVAHGGGSQVVRFVVE